MKRTAKPTTTIDMQRRILSLARETLTGRQCCEVAADLLCMAGVRNETILAFLNRMPVQDASALTNYLSSLGES